MSRTETDVLSHHQSRRGASRMPSQSHLQSFQSLSTSSYLGSLSHSDAFIEDSDPSARGSTKLCAQCGTHGQGKQSVKDLDEDTKEIIEFARVAMVNEMVLVLGWCEGEGGHRE